MHLFSILKSFTENGRNRFCFGERHSNGQYVIDFIPLYETVVTSKETGCEISYRRLRCPSEKLLKDIELPTPYNFVMFLLRQNRVQHQYEDYKGKEKLNKWLFFTLAYYATPFFRKLFLVGVTLWLSLRIFIRFTEERLLKHKSKAPKYLKVFLKYNPTLKKFACDNDKEYLPNDFVNFSTDLDIVIEPVSPYTLSLNGVAADCSWI